MMKTLLRKTSVLAAFGAALCLFGTVAEAMTVQPVIVDLATAGGRMSAVVTVENTFATPLPVELKVVEADFNNGLVTTNRETEDLLIFPPQALIQPGRTQSFRVQWVGDPDLKQSKHYFLTVAQLPVKLPEGQSAVQILYNFQVIISVGVPGAKPDVQVTGTEQVKGEDGKVRLALDLRNDSNTYGYLSEGTLKIVAKDGKGAEVMRKSLTGAEILQQMGYGLVGPGQTRKLNTSIELPVEGGTVEATFSPRTRR